MYCTCTCIHVHMSYPSHCLVGFDFCQSVITDDIRIYMNVVTINVWALKTLLCSDNCMGTTYTLGCEHWLAIKDPVLKAGVLY